MDNKITTISLDEHIEDFYDCMNKICPICKNEIKEVTGIAKLGNVIYHIECYFKSTSDRFKIK